MFAEMLCELPMETVFDITRWFGRFRRECRDPAAWIILRSVFMTNKLRDWNRIPRVLAISLMSVLAKRYAVVVVVWNQNQWRDYGSPEREVNFEHKQVPSTTIMQRQ